MDNLQRHKGLELGTSLILKTEPLAALVSAYLDKQLKGAVLAEFEALLRENKAFACEIGKMQQIEIQLSKIGDDILSEPIPEVLLEALGPNALAV
jgi:hypothetical protein